MVWNRGPPPHPRAAFDSAVPVRVRVEPQNSMNNRFKPDAGIKFRCGLVGWIRVVDGTPVSGLLLRPGWRDRLRAAGWAGASQASRTSVCAQGPG